MPQVLFRFQIFSISLVSHVILVLSNAVSLIADTTRCRSLYSFSNCGSVYFNFRELPLLRERCVIYSSIRYNSNNNSVAVTSLAKRRPDTFLVLGSCVIWSYTTESDVIRWHLEHLLTDVTPIKFFSPNHKCHVYQNDA